jgi:hypothetical protein
MLYRNDRPASYKLWRGKLFFFSSSSGYTEPGAARYVHFPFQRTRRKPRTYLNCQRIKFHYQFCGAVERLRTNHCLCESDAIDCFHYTHRPFEHGYRARDGIQSGARRWDVRSSQFSDYFGTAALAPDNASAGCATQQGI